MKSLIFIFISLSLLSCNQKQNVIFGVFPESPVAIDARFCQEVKQSSPATPPANSGQTAEETLTENCIEPPWIRVRFFIDNQSEDSITAVAIKYQEVGNQGEDQDLDIYSLEPENLIKPASLDFEHAKDPGGCDTDSKILENLKKGFLYVISPGDCYQFDYYLYVNLDLEEEANQTSSRVERKNYRKSLRFELIGWYGGADDPKARLRVFSDTVKTQ